MQWIILANLATKAGVEKTGKFKIHVPLIVLSKKEIIKLGHDLNLDFSMTHTCYDPKNNGKSCGLCDACILRLEGFKEAGLIDPISYDRVGL
jgi:7-cyano-7-deazaguanine synthase